MEAIDTYIVRVYRRDPQEVRQFSGLVEIVASGGKKAFADGVELLEILSRKSHRFKRHQGGNHEDDDYKGRAPGSGHGSGGAPARGLPAPGQERGAHGAGSPEQPGRHRPVQLLNPVVWDDNSDNEDNFVLEYDTIADFSGKVEISLPEDTTDKLVEGLDASTKHYFRVKAVNAVGASPYSNVGEATTQDPPLQPPAAPSGLTATAVSSSSIWNLWTGQLGQRGQLRDCLQQDRRLCRQQRGNSVGEHTLVHSRLPGGQHEVLLPREGNEFRRLFGLVEHRGGHDADAARRHHGHQRRRCLYQ